MSRFSNNETSLNFRGSRRINTLGEEVKNKKLKIPEMSAGEIAKHALIILDKEYNIEAWRQNNLAVRGRKFIGKPGLSDCLGFHRLTGKIALCEIKTIGDVFSKDQIKLLTQVHEAGGVALIAIQEGLRVKVKYFKELGYSHPIKK